MTPGIIFTSFDDDFNRLLLLNLLWTLTWVGGSIVYRRVYGKPVLFFGVPDAVFQERVASGYSTRNLLTRMGGAHNALVVAVTRDRLVIRPYFPFTLLFLPEIYGLDYEVPLHNVIGTKEKKVLLWTSVSVEFHNADNEVREVVLRLRNPKDFLAALNLPAQR